MKRNLLTKSILVSVALSAVLTGCGSLSPSDDSTQDAVNNNNQSKTISGKAVDGYLQFATVCLDISNDGYCQANEPSTMTDKDGGFTLDIKPEIEKDVAFAEAMLLVYGGKDADTGSDFRGKLLAPQDAEIVNISPITTLIAKVVQKELKADKKLTKEEVKAKIKASKEQFAKVFNIPEEDLLKDPVAEKLNNPKLIKEALKLQKMVEAMSKDKANDTLEKMYERLAESLDAIAAEEGLDALLDEAFKGEEAKLNKARALSKNIDTSFEKFKDDIDLRKIATIIKEDMRKVERGETVPEMDIDDDRFAYDDVAWEDEYIKSDLIDIGVPLPTPEQISKIKESISGSIKPGIIFEKEKDFKDKEEKIFKDIYKQIKKEKAKKEAKKEDEKAKYAGKRVKFEKGMTLFDFDVDSYTKIEIGTDDTIYIKEYELTDGAFLEIQKERQSPSNNTYILENGAWIVDDLDKSSFKYTLGDSGLLTIPQTNIEVMLVNQKDLSNKEVYLDALDAFVKMPEGASVSYIGFKQKEDVYTLDSPLSGATTISEYVAQQCKLGGYKKEDGTACDETSTKGKSRYGSEWSIKKVGGIEILTEKNKWSKEDGYEDIYAEYNGNLYRGGYEKLGKNKDVDANYNAKAIEAIKAIMIEQASKRAGDVTKTPVAIK